MFHRKKQEELSDEELAAQTLQNCRMSMMSQFQEQAVIADEDIMQEFFASPEYREALSSFLKRRGV